MSTAYVSAPHVSIDLRPYQRDALTASLQRCTVCGWQEGPRAWFDIWSGETLAVALLVCGPCRATDPGHVAVERLRQERYREGQMKAGEGR